MQNAIEPVHIQLNLNSLDVLVINRSYKAIPDLIAVADLYSLDSKSTFHKEKNLSLSATDVQQAISLAKPLKGAQGVNFVVLNLKNKSGQIVSHNVYWLSKDEDFTSLNGIAQSSVQVEVVKKSKGSTEKSWTIKVTNSTGRIAFFIRPQLLVNGEEVLPSYWSGSYFTLAPDESTTVTVACPVEKTGTGIPELKISGWNVAGQIIKLSV